MRGLIIGLFLIAGIVGWRAGGTSEPVAVPAEGGAAPERQSGGTITLQRSWQGHFFVDGDVAGRSLRFVVDTGATTVAMGRDDAARIGIDLSDAQFDQQMRTASGTIMAAEVTLPRLRVGEIQMSGVRATVLDIADTVPMLGQSFLSRLDRVSIEGDRMVLVKS